MTEDQLNEYYSKLPRTEKYDSDDDQGVIKSADRTDFPQQSVNVAKEDEHARDLLEALNGLMPDVPKIVEFIVSDELISDSQVHEW